MKRAMVLAVAFAAAPGLLMLGACKKEKKDETGEVAGAAKEEPKTEEKAEPAEPAKEEPKKEEAAGGGGGGDSVGVPECDEYISKYTKCVSDKVPAASKAMMEKSLNTMKDAWRKAAQTEAGKKGLAQACKTALEAAKKSMASFNCEW